MPYTKKQRALFHAAEKDPAIAKKKSLSQGKARELAKEADAMPVKPAVTKRPKSKRK